MQFTAQENTKENERVEVLLGNAAMGRGLLEGGCRIATAYPGTPSSEILPAFLHYAKAENIPVYAEWSANEKVAFEEGLAASYTGLRTAVIMKQVGLNVAADAMMSSAYTGVKGGFLIISADDPGPHSSQTEQDTRIFGLFAKIPVLDPMGPDEARRMIPFAFELSEKYEVPVILRPALRVCHGRESTRLETPLVLDRKADFQKDKHRWAATPRYRYTLHKELNKKLEQIEESFETNDQWNWLDNGDAAEKSDSFGIVAAGMPYATVCDILKERGVFDKIPILKVGTPFPLPRRLVEEFIDRHEHVLLVEEPDGAIELQLSNRAKVMGRSEGTIPDQGELTADVLTGVLGKVLSRLNMIEEAWPAPGETEVESVVRDLNLPIRPASLCAGCSHRSAFYAIKTTFGKKGIYTSDIGCYTLGLNLDAVDTCLDMGAAVSMATGFYHAYKNNPGGAPPIVATIGDSTFYHGGLTGLATAVYSDARYIIVILDNLVTAMTGMQPTLASGLQADGTMGNPLPLEDACKGLGVSFLKIHDPYDIEGMQKLLKDAWEHCCSPDGRVAVIIARHPCLIHDRRNNGVRIRVDVTGDCNGCALCRVTFECPALVKGKAVEGKKDRFYTRIDRRFCSDCGQCVVVCKRGALSPQES